MIRLLSKVFQSNEEMYRNVQHKNGRGTKTTPMLSPVALIHLNKPDKSGPIENSVATDSQEEGYVWQLFQSHSR